MSEPTDPRRDRKSRSMSEPLLNGGPDPISEALLPPGVRRRGRSHPSVIDATRRLGWGLVESGRSSERHETSVLGCWCAGAAAAATGKPSSIASVTYMLALGASRALASEPLSALPTASPQNAERRRGVRSAGGLAGGDGNRVGVGAAGGRTVTHLTLQESFLDARRDDAGHSSGRGRFASFGGGGSGGHSSTTSFGRSCCSRPSRYWSAQGGLRSVR